MASLILLGLSACARAPEAPPPVASFRDRAVPIASMALFDATRFSGDWVIVASYPGPDSCLGGQVTLSETAEGLTEVLRCTAGANRQAPAQRTGPGRYRVEGAERWVLWVDQGYRTAVIGTPDGSFAWILNRSPRIPADRVRAAREILDFNGYNVASLRETPK